MDIKQARKHFMQNPTSGLLSLEASIALTIFLFLMLFMYSFLVVFEARNQIGHVLLTTADSLSLDAFANESLGNEKSIQGILYRVYETTQSSNGYYTESSKWYSGEGAVEETVKTRFLAYLSGGDRAEANRILRELNIVGGLDGLDFSNCRVSGNDLFLEVSYELEYEFQVFQLDTLSFRQSCCSKLWK